MNAVEEIRQYVRSRGLEACCLDFPGSIELAIDEEELELIRSGHGEFWDEEKVTEVLGCRPGSFRGGMFHAGGGKVSPLVLRDALLQDAIDRGARLLSSCVVERIEEKDDRVVLHTCMKTIEVEKVIVCSNAWIPQILSEYESIIRPTCDVVLMTRPLPPAWKFGFTAGDDQWYGMQMQDGRIFLGGASRECECLSLESERNVNEDASRQLRDFMSKFPFLSESDIEAEWTGLIAETPDLRPVVGAVPGRKRVWVCGGFSGHGMPVSCSLARETAEMALRGERRSDKKYVSCLDAARFHRSQNKLPPLHDPGRGEEEEEAREDAREEELEEDIDQLFRELGEKRGVALMDALKPRIEAPLPPLQPAVRGLCEMHQEGTKQG